MAEYFSLTRIQYPESTRAPRSLNGKQLTLTFDNDQGTLIAVFDSAGQGTYTYDGAPGLIRDYAWIQEAYRGRLGIEFSAVLPMILQLDFATEEGGRFAGTVYPPEALPPIAGSFTLETP